MAGRTAAAKRSSASSAGSAGDGRHLCVPPVACSRATTVRRAVSRLGRAKRAAARPRPGAPLPAGGRARPRGAGAAVDPRCSRPSGHKATASTARPHVPSSPMSAPAIAAGKPTLRIGGTATPAAADAARPAPAPRVGDRHAAGARPRRLRLPALDRPDPRLARDLRGARGLDRVPPPAGAHVARQRPPHRQRRRVRPPRARHGARRLVEHERLVDLRRARPPSGSSRST